MIEENTLLHNNGSLDETINLYNTQIEQLTEKYKNLTDLDTSYYEIKTKIEELTQIRNWLNELQYYRNAIKDAKNLVNTIKDLTDDDNKNFYVGQKKGMEEVISLFE